MFPFPESDTTVPSLVFTKAELIYALLVLTPDISPEDNATKIEMVELRHYLNLIKDRIAKAISDGTLRQAMATSSPRAIDNDAVRPSDATPKPTIDELRRRFPMLTQGEIEEIISNARGDRSGSEAEVHSGGDSQKEAVQSSFVVKSPSQKGSTSATLPSRPLSDKSRRDMENARKFASLLGAQ